MLFVLLLLLTSLLWAGNFVAGKFVVGHASIYTLTMLRYLIAIVFLIPIVYVREKRLLLPKQAVIPLIWMGLFGTALFNVFLFLALEYTSSDTVGLLSALNPIAIAIASFFLLQERLTKQQLVGMFVSFLGVVIVVSRGNLSQLLKMHLNVGALSMLVSVASWGLFAVFGRKSMHLVSPYMATLWSGIFGVLVLIPFYFLQPGLQRPTWSFWLGIFYIGFLATVGAMVFWNIGVQKVGGTKAGMFLNFNPIFTAILAYLWLGENLYVAQWIGMAFVISGVYLYTRAKRAGV